MKLKVFDLPPRKKIELPEEPHTLRHGIQAWRNKYNKFVGVMLHYSADPEKDNIKWIEQARQGISREAWEQEYELNIDISWGAPVFSDFNRRKHVKYLEFDPSYPLIRGWDFGRQRPAVVWIQYIEDKDTFHVLHEFIGHNIDVRTLARKAKVITDQFPDCDIFDYGDPAGHQRTDKDVKSTIEILRDEGIYVSTRKLGWHESVDIINTLFRENKIFINSLNCDLLIDGLAGGYHYKSETDDKPARTVYTDVIDAFRYAICNVITTPTSKPRKRVWIPPRKSWLTGY